MADVKTPKPIRHGEHAGYSRGCRCDDCRTAHRIYNRDRLRVIRRWEQGIGPEPVSRMVSPYRSRRHLQWLKTKGVSINAVSLASGINEATLKKIRSGKSKYVWRTTQDAILAVHSHANGPKQLVSAEYSEKIARAIRDKGYTILQVNQMMGRAAHPSPLIRGKYIRIETQEKWEALYLKLFRHPAPFKKPTKTKAYYDNRKRKS